MHVNHASHALLKIQYVHASKIANNRHSYNRDVRQSYWTSDELPLYCIQQTGEKTNNVKDLPRSDRPRVTYDRDDRAL
jgi:hypothetical protein